MTFSHRGIILLLTFNDLSDSKGQPSHWYLVPAWERLAKGGLFPGLSPVWQGRRNSWVVKY